MARYTAPTPLFSSVWQIVRGMDSAFKTPHTSPFVNHSAALESFFPILFRLTCQCWSFRVLDLNPMRLGGIEVH
jgi:hypothetical protein